MPNDLKVGDVVKLKSGGPSMTVMSKDVRTELDELRCGWFVEEIEFHSEKFPSLALNKTKREIDQP